MLLFPQDGATLHCVHCSPDVLVDKTHTGCKKGFCSEPTRYWFVPSHPEKQSEILLHHIAVVELSPLEDVLLTDNVRVDEKVAITHTEVLLAGGAFETLQMVDLVSHTHSHLKRPDPLFTGSTQTVLTKQPEWSMIDKEDNVTRRHSSISIQLTHQNKRQCSPNIPLDLHTSYKLFK